MHSDNRTNEFFFEVATQIRAISRLALIFMAALSMIAVVTEIVWWRYQPSIETSVFTLLLTSLLWFVAGYGVVSQVLGVRPTLNGLTKFVATSIAVAVPAIASLALLKFVARSENGVLLMLGLATVAGVLVLTPLLAGWPALQITSDRLVGPISALKLTRGIRWSLFWSSWLIVAIGRVVPAPSPDDSAPVALGLAAAAGVVAFVSALLAVSIAVTAWDHMSRRQRFRVS